MLFETFDLLSPKITLYYRNKLGHTSKTSGILTLLFFLLILSFLSYYITILFKRTSKNIFYYKSYFSDPGRNFINSSNLFHYLTLGENLVYDSRAISIIGVTDKSTEVLRHPDRKTFDYWNYSECHLGKEYPPEAALDNKTTLCISSFYNHSNNKTYLSNESDFVPPNVDHGTDNPNFVPYIIMVQKCRNSTTHKHCYPEEKINTYLSSFYYFTIRATEKFVNIGDYEDPIRSHMRSVQIDIKNQTIQSTSLHFSPYMVQTHEGFILDSVRKINEFSLETVTQVETPKAKDFLVGMITFLVHNKGYVYERRYLNFTEVIVNTSGVAKVISIVLYIINFVYNRYVIYYDFLSVLKIRVSKIKCLSGPVRLNQKSDSKLTLTSRKESFKVFQNKKLNFFSFFLRVRITFFKVIKYYLGSEKEDKMKAFYEFRKKIISEERMIKFYFFSKYLNKTFCRQQTSSTNLVDTMMNNYLRTDAPYKSYLMSNLNKSNTELMASCFSKNYKQEKNFTLH